MTTHLLCPGTRHCPHVLLNEQPCGAGPRPCPRLVPAPLPCGSLRLRSGVCGISSQEPPPLASALGARDLQGLSPREWPVPPVPAAPWSSQPVDLVWGTDVLPLTPSCSCLFRCLGPGGEGSGQPWGPGGGGVLAVMEKAVWPSPAQPGTTGLLFDQRQPVRGPRSPPPFLGSGSAGSPAGICPP